MKEKALKIAFFPAFHFSLYLCIIFTWHYWYIYIWVYIRFLRQRDIKYEPRAIHWARETYIHDRITPSPFSLNIDTPKTQERNMLYAARALFSYLHTFITHMPAFFSFRDERWARLHYTRENIFFHCLLMDDDELI